MHVKHKGGCLRSKPFSLLAALISMFGFACSASTRPASVVAAQPMLVGMAWYPEQWPEQRWDTDLALMEKAGVNAVRIAEFAWSTMEPEEGRYEFGWLDRAIAAAGRHGIKVVLGTPTASPPSWLVRKYDVSRLNEDGTRTQHGFRRNFSFANARYRELARAMASAMAHRYGHNPNVIGWQIDNEIASASFDGEAQAQFHAWLKVRYGTIAELNRRWWTSYWSQTYRSFDEVDMHASGPWNPALMLETRRFASEVWASYLRNQASAIRDIVDPRQSITTNTKSWNGDFDHYVIARELDVAGFDNYFLNGRPDWGYSAAELDRVRGYKQRNFWLLESQPGRIGWNPINRGMDRGVLRQAAWQAIGHGADAVFYWQWRTALGGQEQYHDTFIGTDGTPHPQYEELVGLGAELNRLAPQIAGTSVAARIAFLWSYDSRWALDMQRNHKDFDPIQQFLSWYRAFQPRAQVVDVVSPGADLSSYAAVIAPSLHVMTDAQAIHLANYVRGGGHLVFGVRSGMKDGDNALAKERQPGKLAELLGARVEQYYPLDEIVRTEGELGQGEVKIWAERLQALADDVKVIERFAPYDGWIDGMPAVVARKVGKGSITYAGGWFDDGTMSRLADRILVEAGVAPIVPGLPASVEVMERSGAGRTLLIVINHGKAGVTIPLPTRAKVLLGDARLTAGEVLVVSLDPSAGFKGRY